nr:glycosyltransferase family 4 protein [Ligilactobacillus pobuzihii]
MNEEKKQNIDFRVFCFGSKEKGCPQVEKSYLDKRLNFHNWQRYIFFLKENLVLKDFINLYDHENFDMYHAHTLFSNGYLAYRMNKINGKPYVVAVRDTDLNVFFKLRPYLRKIGVNILKNATKIIFISKNYKSELFSKYVPTKYISDFEAKSMVIPNGINDFFHRNSFLKVEDKYDAQNFNVVTVGWVSKRKNQLSVAKAINKLNNIGFNIKYTVIGKAKSKKIDDALRKFDFVERVPFTQQENLLQYYRNAQVFAMPSLTETFGLTYIEAMSQSLPVVYSKGQGIDGYFKDGEVGYSVNSTDIDEIANALPKIVENSPKLRNNCYYASSKFDWKKIVKQYKKIYKVVLN